MYYKNTSNYLKLITVNYKKSIIFITIKNIFLKIIIVLNKKKWNAINYSICNQPRWQLSSNFVKMHCKNITISCNTTSEPFNSAQNPILFYSSHLSKCYFSLLTVDAAAERTEAHNLIPDTDCEELSAGVD